MARNTKFSERKAWVTKGADPTEVVRWRLYGTELNGDRMSDTYVEVTEFQGVYLGKFICPSNPGGNELTEHVAKLVHQDLEARWQAEQETREEGPNVRF